MPPDALPDIVTALPRIDTLGRIGKIERAVGTTIRVSGLGAHIGETCDAVDPVTGHRVPAEVVGLDGDAAILTPLEPLTGLGGEFDVFRRKGSGGVPFGDALLGRVVDAQGQPLDGKGDLPANLPRRAIDGPAPDPLTRLPVDAPFETGVRAIDGIVPVGRGQRLGVFAMAGVGKSSLLGMLARGGRADVNVVALIGERGREVREFLDDALGDEGLARSVVIVATSDRPAMERARAARTATAIAEGFRAEGRNVCLMMDSVTRYARALREIGLSIGEPAVRRGYPPSVFADLPRLFERAGNDARGSMTAFYTVLVEDEEGDDPVGEEVRSILDGHIVLSRELAARAHYPAIDLLGSVSRVAPRLMSSETAAAAGDVRAMLSKYGEIEFLLQVGEYESGSDPLADKAIERRARIEAFLRQDMGDQIARDDTLAALKGLAE
ncbi:FliI/YscN family ATPase [Pacificimonas sp. WHA3]|uniref:FliI/YscN family ATPase n=1 Tax=Pacificimonas pallii TaxID=2827236 RepID=A0ABS6SFB9_9SPHN|nr:FliI/YscN family ATPase [Pacificimonas pallii]MBV7256950.1 FliI/YscN family ATPase [Pacificimonas pallii]